MEDINNHDKKSKELYDEDTSKVSGGYGAKNSGDKTMYCDKCQSGGAVPIRGEHLCLNCLKSLRYSLGEECFKACLSN